MAEGREAGARAEPIGARRPVTGPVRWVAPDATFLAWLDCRQLDLGGREPAEFFERACGVRMFRGKDFGPLGAGHVRLNFGTYPEVLDEVLNRMRRGCADLGS